MAPFQQNDNCWCPLNAAVCILVVVFNQSQNDINPPNHSRVVSGDSGGWIMNGHCTAPHCARLQERAQPAACPRSSCPPVIIHPHQRLFDPAPLCGHGGHQHIVQQATLPALADQCQCHFCCIYFFIHQTHKIKDSLFGPSVMKAENNEASYFTIFPWTLSWIRQISNDHVFIKTEPSALNCILCPNRHR